MTMTLKLTQDGAEWRIQTQANEQVSGALAAEGGCAGVQAGPRVLWRSRKGRRKRPREGRGAGVGVGGAGPSNFLI